LIVKHSQTMGDELEINCKPITIEGSERVTVVASKELTSNLDRLDLNVTSDYYKSFRNSGSPSYKVTAKEYLCDRDERGSDESLLCAEMPLTRDYTPAVRLRLPAGVSWNRQAVALIHAGRNACVAPVHFDWDHKWVAHACLIGRKRFFFFPPHAAWLLSPVINTSALDIMRFSESDRSEILNRLGGTEVVLNAGQGVLFPSMYWHGVLHEEPSLAVSVRFEPSPSGRPFAVLPRSWMLQRLVWRFFQQGYGSEADDFLVEYLESFFRYTKGWKSRYRRSVELCRRTLMQYGEQQGVITLSGENFSSEMALASEELKLYYGNVVERQETIGAERFEETRDYIFPCKDRKLSAQDLQLATYALQVRQGLPPKRGLVEIEQE
jgi:hypothetical protein